MRVLGLYMHMLFGGQLESKCLILLTGSELKLIER